MPLPLPTNIDATYADDATRPDIKAHQQYHDTIHTAVNDHETRIDTLESGTSVAVDTLAIDPSTHGVIYGRGVSDAVAIANYDALAALFAAMPSGAIVDVPAWIKVIPPVDVSGTRRNGLVPPDHTTFFGSGDNSGFLYGATDLPGYVFKTSTATTTTGVRFYNMTLEDGSGGLYEFASSAGSAIYLGAASDLYIDWTVKFLNWQLTGLVLGSSTVQSTNVRCFATVDGGTVVTALGVSAFFVAGLTVKGRFNKVARPLSLELTTTACSDIDFDDALITNSAVATASATNTVVGVLATVQAAGGSIARLTIGKNVQVDGGTGVGGASQAYPLAKVSGFSAANRNVTDVTVCGRVTNFTPRSSADVGVFLQYVERFAVDVELSTASTYNPIAITDSGRGVVRPGRIDGFAATLNESATIQLDNVYFMAATNQIAQVPNIATSKSSVIRLTSALIGLLADAVRLGPANELTVTSGSTNVQSNMAITDAKNISVGTATGTKIGTAANQKLGHYGVTPVVQPATTGEATGFTAGAGVSVTDQSTFTGGTGATAYRINDIVKALKALGLLAA